MFGKYIIPRILTTIERADDIDTIIENENKLACIFASPILFFVAILNLVVRNLILHENAQMVFIDSAVCILLGLAFEVTLRSKLKLNILVNSVAILYASWCIFVFLRFSYLLGPLVWIIAFFQLMLAMFQVKKNMLIISGIVISIAGIIFFFKAPVANYEIGKLFYGLMVLVFVLILIIAEVVHSNNRNRYKKMVLQLNIVMDQKKEIEKLYQEVTENEIELHQQNEILTAYNNLIKQNEEKLHFLAYHDMLTELPNRKLVYQRLEEMIHTAKEQKNSFHVVYIDIDYFKNINDTMGHDAGDNFISAVANRLKTAVFEEDLLGRMGGDEFILIIPRDRKEQELLEYLSSIKDSFEESFIIQGKKINSTASFGIASYPKDGQDAVMLLKNADIAMYKSKELGKNRIQCYHPKMQSEMLRRIENNNL